MAFEYIEIIQSILLLISAFLIIVATVGVLRLNKDMKNVVYARIHILGVIDIAGVLAFFALGQSLLGILYLILAPFLAHALANAYYYAEDDFNESKDLESNNSEPGDLKSKNLDSEDLDSGDLKSKNLDSEDLDSGDLKSKNLDSEDLDSGDLKSKNLDSEDLDSGDSNLSDSESDLISDNLESEDLTYNNSKDNIKNNISKNNEPSVSTLKIDEDE